MWGLVAAAVVLANIVVLVALRLVAREARALTSAATRLGRIAVANDDLRSDYARVAPAYAAVRPRLRRRLRR